MGIARQFWLFVVPLLVGFTAAGVLVLAFFFPDQLFSVSSTGYIATAVVTVVALGLVVYQTVVFDNRRVGGLGGSEER